MAERVGVVGAGTMGAGIAQGAAMGGFDVLLYDRDPAAVARTLARIADSLARSVAKGKIDAADAEAAKARLRPAAAMAELAPCTLVIEAIIEDAAAKAALFAELSQVVRPPAVLATNTSSFRVDDLARTVAAPQRFVGLHYFFPAAVNPLLEVIRGEASSDAAMATAFDFARRTGKCAIACKDWFGFAVNRFFVPYINEAARLVDEGFTPGEVDKAACEAFKTPAGPLKVMDLTKPEIGLHAARTLAVMGPFYAPAPSLVRVGEARGLWNPEDLDAVAPERAKVIADRLMGAVFVAVREALDEGVCGAEDIDTGARLGLVWGWQPCAAMAEMGPEAVSALLAPYRSAYGVRV